MLTYPILQYDEPLYRPPSEGRNLIIQTTIGCSFNRCTFCSMYKSKMFRACPLTDVCVYHLRLFTYALADVITGPVASPSSKDAA